MFKYFKILLVMSNATYMTTSLDNKIICKWFFYIFVESFYCEKYINLDYCEKYINSDQCMHSIIYKTNIYMQCFQKVLLK